LVKQLFAWQHPAVHQLKTGDTANSDCAESTGDPVEQATARDRHRSWPIIAGVNWHGPSLLTGFGVVDGNLPDINPYGARETEDRRAHLIAAAQSWRSTGSFIDIPTRRCHERSPLSSTSSYGTVVKQVEGSVRDTHGVAAHDHQCDDQ
jgi:hypothetical protein